MFVLVNSTAFVAMIIHKQTYKIFYVNTMSTGARGSVVVKALYYKLESLGFDPQ
jgi:hypothetical protein